MNSRNSEKENNFFKLVYEIVRFIPKGRVTSYGAIAKAIGSKASRQVGMAMNYSHGVEPPVPAHRVVNRIGLLTGKHHFEDEFAMQRMLEAEGVVIINDRVIDFERIFWDPILEMEI